MFLSFFSAHLIKEYKLARQRKIAKLYTIVLEYPNGLTRSVQVRAAERDIAEKRALKRNPSATGVKRDA